MEPKYDFTCEVCGRTDRVTDAEAYRLGWDYPPFMGQWNVICPRTCPNCGIEETVWWALVVDKKDAENLTVGQTDTVHRILTETPR